MALSLPTGELTLQVLRPYLRLEALTCRYSSILDSLSETERGKLQRSMGLKIEQLKV